MTEIYSRISALTAQMCLFWADTSPIYEHTFCMPSLGIQHPETSPVIQGDAFEHLENEVAKGRIATLLLVGTVSSDVADVSRGYRMT